MILHFPGDVITVMIHVRRNKVRGGVSRTTTERSLVYTLLVIEILLLVNYRIR